MMEEDELLRSHLIGMIEAMGYIVVPPWLYDHAVWLLPQVADKIVKSDRLPVGDARQPTDDARSISTPAAPEIRNGGPAPPSHDDTDDTG